MKARKQRASVKKKGVTKDGGKDASSVGSVDQDRRCLRVTVDMDERVVMDVALKGRARRTSPRSMARISLLRQTVNSVTLSDSESPDKRRSVASGMVRGGRKKRGQSRNNITLSIVSSADSLNPLRNTSPRKSAQKCAGKDKLCAQKTEWTEPNENLHETAVSATLNADIMTHDTRHSSVRTNSEVGVARRGRRQSPRGQSKLTDIAGQSASEPNLNNHVVLSGQEGRVSSRKTPVAWEDVALVSGDGVAMVMTDSDAVKKCKERSSSAVLPTETHCGEGDCLVLPSGGIIQTKLSAQQMSPRGRRASPRGRGRGRKVSTHVAQDVVEMAGRPFRNSRVGRVNRGHIVRVCNRGRLKNAVCPAQTLAPVTVCLSPATVSVSPTTVSMSLASTIKSPATIILSPTTGIVAQVTATQALTTVSASPTTSSNVRVKAQLQTHETNVCTRQMGETGSTSLSRLSLKTVHVKVAGRKRVNVEGTARNLHLNKHKHVKNYWGDIDHEEDFEPDYEEEEGGEDHAGVGGMSHGVSSPTEDECVEQQVVSECIAVHQSPGDTVVTLGDTELTALNDSKLTEDSDTVVCRTGDTDSREVLCGETPQCVTSLSDDKSGDMSVKNVSVTADGDDSMTADGDDSMTDYCGQEYDSSEYVVVEVEEFSDTGGKRAFIREVSTDVSDTAMQDRHRHVYVDNVTTDHLVVSLDNTDLVVEGCHEATREAHSGTRDSTNDTDDNTCTAREIEHAHIVNDSVGDSVGGGHMISSDSAQRSGQCTVPITTDTLDSKKSQGGQKTGFLPTDHRVTEDLPGHLSADHRVTEDLPTDHRVTGDLSGHLSADHRVTDDLSGHLSSDHRVTGDLSGQLSSDHRVTGDLSGQLSSDHRVTGDLSGQLSSDHRVTGDLSGQLSSDHRVTGDLSGQLSSDHRVTDDLSGHLSADHRGSEDGHSETSSTCSQVGTVSSLTTQQQQGRVRKRCWKRITEKTAATGGWGKKTKITLRRPDRLAGGRLTVLCDDHQINSTTSVTQDVKGQATTREKGCVPGKASTHTPSGADARLPTIASCGSTYLPAHQVSRQDCAINNDVISRVNRGSKTSLVSLPDQTYMKLSLLGRGPASTKDEPSCPVVNPTQRTVIVKDASPPVTDMSEQSKSQENPATTLVGRLNRAISTKVVTPSKGAIHHRVAVCKDKVSALAVGRINRSPEILPVVYGDASCRTPATTGNTTDRRNAQSATTTFRQTADRANTPVELVRKTVKSGTQMSADESLRQHRTTSQRTQAQNNASANTVAARTNTGTVSGRDIVSTGEGPVSSVLDSESSITSVGGQTTTTAGGQTSSLGKRAMVSSPVLATRLGINCRYRVTTSGRTAGRPLPSSNIVKMISMGIHSVSARHSDSAQVQSRGMAETQSSQITRTQSSEKPQIYQSSEKMQPKSSDVENEQHLDKSQVQSFKKSRVQSAQCLGRAPMQCPYTNAHISELTQVQRVVEKPKGQSSVRKKALASIKAEVPTIGGQGRVSNVSPVEVFSEVPFCKVEFTGNDGFEGDKAPDVSCCVLPVAPVGKHTSGTAGSANIVKTESIESDKSLQDPHLPPGDKSEGTVAIIDHQEDKIWKVWKSRFNSSAAAVLTVKELDDASAGHLVVNDDTCGHSEVSMSSSHPEVDREQGTHSSISDADKGLTNSNKRQINDVTERRTFYTEETVCLTSELTTYVTTHSSLSSESVSTSKRAHDTAPSDKSHPSKVLRLGADAASYQVVGADQVMMPSINANSHQVMGADQYRYANSYMRTIQMCLSADTTDCSHWDSLAQVFRKLLGRYHAIWTKHLEAMINVIAREMDELTNQLDQFLLALQRQNIEVPPHLYTTYLGRIGAGLVERCVQDSREEHIYGIITHLHRRGTHVYPFQGDPDNYFLVAKAILDACLQHSDIDLMKKIFEENCWLYRDGITCRRVQLRICGTILWQICQLLRESSLRGEAPYIIEMFSLAQFLFVALCQDSVEDAEMPGYKDIIDLNVVFDELLRIAMDKKVLQVLLQIYSYCIGLTTKDIFDMRLDTHRDIVLFLYAHRHFDATSFQEAVRVANHATVCGLYPEQPKSLASGSTVKLWSCMSQQEMYLVTYAYIQELKQKLHSNKWTSSAIYNVQIRLETLPDEPRYENVFGTIMGTVKVHQRRVEQMAEKDFDPPLSGVWLYCDIFKLDPASVEAYLTHRHSGSTNALASNCSPSKTFVKTADNSSELSLCTSSFSQNVLPPNVSAVSQSTSTTSVTLGVSGLSHVTKGQPANDTPHTAKGISTAGNSFEDSTWYCQPFTHWNQPTTSHLHLQTDFTVPSPAAVLARQHSTPGGTTKRPYTAAVRCGGQLTPKRHQRSSSATTQVQYADTNDMLMSCDIDIADAWQSHDQSSESQDSVSVSSSLMLESSWSGGDKRWGEDGKSWETEFRDDMNWGTEIRADMNRGTEIKGDTNCGREVRGNKGIRKRTIYPGAEHETSYSSALQGADTRWRPCDGRFTSARCWINAGNVVVDTCSSSTGLGRNVKNGPGRRTCKRWDPDTNSQDDFSSPSRSWGAATNGVSETSCYPATKWGANTKSWVETSANPTTQWGTNSWGEKSSDPTMEWGANTNSWGDKSSNRDTKWDTNTNSWGDKSSDPVTEWGTNSWGDKPSDPVTKWGTNSWGDKSSDPVTKWGTNSWGDESSNASTKWGTDTNSWGEKSTNPATNWGADVNSWGDRSCLPTMKWGADTNIQGGKSCYQTENTMAASDDRLSNCDAGAERTFFQNFTRSAPGRIGTPPVERLSRGQGETGVALAHRADTGRVGVTAKVLQAVCDRLQFHVRQKNVTEEKCEIVTGGIVTKFCEKYVTNCREFSDDLFNALVEFVDDKVAILQS